MAADAKSDDETAIRALIEKQARGIREKDTERALGAFSDTAMIYDLAPPLSHALSRADTQAWFDTWRGPIGYELRDLEVAANDGIAFCHGFARLQGTKVDGAESGLWFRLTLCLRKQDGAWRIVHEHSSVPFAMDGSVRAAVDLQPPPKP